MKKKSKRWMIIPVLALVLSGCDNGIRSDANDVAATGGIAFECGIASRVALHNNGTRTLPESVMPDINDIALVITSNEDEEFSLHYSTMRRYDKPLLTEGLYTAHFSCGDIDEEGEEKACFAGQTEFTIVARTTITEEVTLSLANSVINLTTSEWFQKYYTDYSLTLRTDSGLERTYTGTSDMPVVDTEALFVKPAGTISLSGSAVKTNGIEVEFPETVLCVTRPNTWHEIEVTAGEASEGCIKIQLDDKMMKIKEKEIELNPEA